jgi:hypothetical protein
MITLATLPTATAQEIFDQVATHLIKQNEKSRDDDRGLCVYRIIKEDRVLKCAAGCLIGDNEYDPAFEKFGPWKSLCDEGKVPDAHADVIRGLQVVHDHRTISEWPRGLQSVAETFQLQFKPEQYGIVKKP